MTEIQIDVDLPHPSERVWRAVTDPRILCEWFMEASGVDEVTGTFILTPKPGDGGFDDPVTGEVVEVETSRRLVMRWTSENFHTLVTVTILPDGYGCQLSFIQRGFIQQGTLRRRVMYDTYARMFEIGLPAALKRLENADKDRDNLKRRRTDPTNHAGRQAGRRNQARFFSGVPRQASRAWEGIKAAGKNMSRRSSPQESWPHSRQSRARGVATPAGEALSDAPTTAMALARWAQLDRTGQTGKQRRIAIAASSAILLLLTLLAVVIDHAVEPGMPGSALGSEDQHGVIAPGGVTPGAASAKAAPQVLSAVYRTDRTVVGGYEGVILVNNLSTRAVNGWSVVVALPPLGLVVHDVRGALAEQAEREVRFSPVPQTRVVPAGESVGFVFQVQGVGAPVGCVIEGRMCAGIPE